MIAKIYLARGFLPQGQIMRKAIETIRAPSHPGVSGRGWKSEKASSAGELSHTSHPLGGRCRMTPWKGAVAEGREKRVAEDFMRERGAPCRASRRPATNSLPLPPSAVQWKALRTTKALERINEEFRHRTKAQAALPNQSCCCRSDCCAAARSSCAARTPPNHPATLCQRLVSSGLSPKSGKSPASRPVASS